MVQYLDTHRHECVVTRKAIIPDSRNHLTRNDSLTNVYERLLEVRHMEYYAIISLEFEERRRFGPHPARLV